MAANVKNLKTISVRCNQCHGDCWDEDQSKRQANVRKRFGLPIPNDCVDYQNGKSKCPFKP